MPKYSEACIRQIFEMVGGTPEQFVEELRGIDVEKYGEKEVLARKIREDAYMKKLLQDSPEQRILNFYAFMKHPEILDNVREGKLAFPTSNEA